MQPTMAMPPGPGPSRSPRINGGFRRRTTVAAAVALGGLLAGAYLAVPTLGSAEAHEFRRQEPAWQRCEKKPELDCATVTVPLDYNRPDAATIDLAISRLKTSVADKRRGIMMLNPGGPGGGGVSMPLEMRERLPRSVLEQYDLIGFDPRGVDGSGRVTCELTADEEEELSPYKPETFAADVTRARSVAEKCGNQNVNTISYITTRNTTRDMDVIRSVLGEKKISYFGQSYGTYLGAVYLQLFPQHADRIVLDNAVDPALVWRGMIQLLAAASQSAFDRWTRWTARHHDTYGLGDTPQEVSRTFWHLVQQADREPIQYDGAPWTGDRIREEALDNMFAVKDAAVAIRNLKQAAAGVPGTPPAPVRQADSAEPDPFTNTIGAASLAIFCNDTGTWPRDPEQYRRDAIRDKARYPLAGDMTSNIQPCAFWTVPRTEDGTTVDNGARALIVQNEWDSRTPAASGLGLHRALKGSRLVFVENGEGHGVYRPNGNACAYAAVNAYLSTGTLPAANVTCTAPDPAP